MIYLLCSFPKKKNRRRKNLNVLLLEVFKRTTNGAVMYMSKDHFFSLPIYLRPHGTLGKVPIQHILLARTFTLSGIDAYAKQSGDVREIEWGCTLSVLVLMPSFLFVFCFFVSFSFLFFSFFFFGDNMEYNGENSRPFQLPLSVKIAG